MTIFFTDEEKEYIDKKAYHWRIRKDCPERLKGKLQKKLDCLYNPKYYQAIEKKK